MKNKTYDIETYPNFFSCVVKDYETGHRWIFEVSDRYNHAADFYNFIHWSAANDYRHVGFNNVGFDYPVIHACMKIGPTFTYTDAYNKAQAIIDGFNGFGHLIWPSDMIVPQVDLFKIRHFDNRAKSISLKGLEFNMRSPNIGDLPFPPGTVLDNSQKDMVINYNCHDVGETERFLTESKEQLDFRDTLSAKIGMDTTNFNDTKIGKKYFRMKLEEARPGVCGTSSQPNQTPRSSINLNDIIFHYITFQSPEMQNTLSYLKACTITETLKVPEFKDLHATLKGFRFDFGTGGIHGSVSRRVIRPQPGQKLIDIDVTSYYPTLAITHEVFPEHLSKLFCEIYEDLFEQRKSHKKGSAENAMLKLALNGVYGDSNNKYSEFFDPQYTMTITVNGQLLLCMLAEAIMLDTDCELIQINTDGMTFVVPDGDRNRFDELCEWWQQLTNLALEDVEYNAMWIRDVNNYIAQGIDGKLKRKGAYEYDLEWHQDFSSLVVQKAAEACMVHGTPLREFVTNHTDGYDFFLRAKVTGKSRLQLMDGTPLQKVTRYYIAQQGQEMEKIMPPLARAKDPTAERHFAINKGFKVAVCDDVRSFDPTNIDLTWYINEAEKLVIR